MAISNQRARDAAAMIAADLQDEGDPKGGKNRIKFTSKRRIAFFNGLALTCNVMKSAAYAGVDKSTVYYHRKHDAAFAEQWQDALAAGYDRLEALIVEHGGAGLQLPMPDGDQAEIVDAPPPFDFDKALAALRHHRASRTGTTFNRGGRPRRNATREETNAALLKALAAAEKRMRAKGGDA